MYGIATLFLLAGTLLWGIWVLISPDRLRVFLTRVYKAAHFIRYFFKYEWPLLLIGTPIIIFIFFWLLPEAEGGVPKAAYMSTGVVAAGWMVTSLVNRQQSRVSTTLNYIEHMRSSEVFLAHQNNCRFLLPPHKTLGKNRLKREIKDKDRDFFEKTTAGEGCSSGACEGRRAFNSYSDVPLHVSLVYLLNSFETISGAILMGHADESYFRRYAIYILNSFFNQYVYAIAYFNKNNRKGEYSDLIKILDQWHLHLPENWLCDPSVTVKDRKKPPWKRIRKAVSELTDEKIIK